MGRTPDGHSMGRWLMGSVSGWGWIRTRWGALLAIPLFLTAVVANFASGGGLRHFDGPDWIIIVLACALAVVMIDNLIERARGKSD